MILPLLLLLSGCGVTGLTQSRTSVSDAKQITQTVTHKGVERSFHIRFSPGYKVSKKYPMVMALHGGGGRGKNFDQIMTNGTLGVAADARSIVLVFPEGIRRQWLDGRQEIVKGDPNRDDVGFLSQLIDAMTSRHAIDPARVYATGISNGGFMSIRLAFDLADKVAAVAPVTAQVTRVLQDRKPARPMPILLVNGTADPLVPYEGGHIRLSKWGKSRGVILSTTDSVSLFARLNGCATTPVVRKLPDIAPADRTTIETIAYSQCINNARVVLMKVVGGGHTWPGGKQYLRARRVGLVSRDINASEQILDFLLSHSLK
jgi:polyhydroxybutyrate depolymerase